MANGHHPMCDVQHETWCLWPGDKCDRCRVIRRAREEALQAARDAVAAIPLTGGWTTPEGVIHEISREQVLAAIDNLRGEVDV